MSGRRIDPATGRLDRSGELVISDFDLHPVEQALALREALGEGEVVVVSLGPASASDALRKTLAMGADRSLLVSDEAFAGADLLVTASALAGALRREQPDLVLFGQQSSDGDGACLWAAVAEHLQLPLISQVSELTLEAGTVTGRRQTEYGYERISAPLPAVVAVSESINQPRYPSLKGIMGAKSKPQEVVTGQRGRRRGRLTDERARALGAARARRAAHRAGRRRGRRGDRRVPGRAETARDEGARLLRAPRRSDHEGLAGRALEGCEPRRRLRRSSSGRMSEGSHAEAGRYGAARVYLADDGRLAAPLPQPRVDVLAALVRREELRHGAVRPVGARDRPRRRARRSPRRGAATGTSPTSSSQAARSSASGRRSPTRSASTSAGARPSGSRSSAAGAFDPVPAPAAARGARARRRARGRARSRAELDRAGGRAGERAVDRGRRRDRRRRPRPRAGRRASRSSRSSPTPSAEPSPRRARSSTPAGTPTRPRSGRPGRPSRRSSTSRSGSPARSSTRSGCRLGRDRRDQQGPERPHLRLRRPRRRRRPERDRARGSTALVRDARSS